MADPFVAEIRIFPFNFAPKGWAFCDGQLLPISQNTALFSLLGTFYGGDGKSTFALPNFQGSAAMHQGQGPGLTDRVLGEAAGSDTVTLLSSEMPAHTHSPVRANTDGGDQNPPTGNVWSLGGAILGLKLYATGGAGPAMHPLALSAAGSGFPHNNLPPYLTLYFNIALQGVYPPRT
ncbi:MAG: phage tail protein [Ignavibacteriae bacterium]|nr:phage tail protein [Ignavibacteria bacterium]MBI3365803.1 phage tail protein [Ignavibacteriota bacterium]